MAAARRWKSSRRSDRCRWPVSPNASAFREFAVCHRSIASNCSWSDFLSSCLLDETRTYEAPLDLRRAALMADVVGSACIARVLAGSGDVGQGGEPNLRPDRHLHGT